MELGWGRCSALPWDSWASFCSAEGDYARSRIWVLSWLSFFFSYPYVKRAQHWSKWCIRESLVKGAVLNCCVERRLWCRGGLGAVDRAGSVLSHCFRKGCTSGWCEMWQPEKSCCPVICEIGWAPGSICSTSGCCQIIANKAKLGRFGLNFWNLSGLLPKDATDIRWVLSHKMFYCYCQCCSLKQYYKMLLYLCVTVQYLFTVEVLCFI